MALATLSIDLEARLARFEQGMSRANGLLDKLDRNASASDDLNDAADATGSTVELLSALEDVARRNGKGLELVSAAVGRLNQALKDADPDSPMSRAIKAIGLSSDELRRLDPSEALQKVAEALAGYADDGNKARWMQVLLGRSAQELAPFLKALADAGKLNATVTTQQAAEAERFNKALAELKANSSNAGRAVASDLLPPLNNALVILAELAKGPGFGAALKATYVEVLTGDARRLFQAQDSLEKYAAKIAEVDRQLAALKSDRRPLVQAGSAREIAGLESQRAQLVKFADAYRNAVNAASPGAGRGVVNLPSAADRGSVPKIPDVTKGRPPAAIFTDFDARISESVAQMIEGGSAAKLAEVNAQLAKLNELEAAGLDAVFISEARAKLYEQLPAKIESASEAFRRLEVSGNDAVNAVFNTDATQRYQEQAARLPETLAALKEGNDVLSEEIAILIGGEPARREAEQARLRSAIATREDTLALKEKAGASEKDLANLRDEIELLRRRQSLLGKRNEAEDVVRQSAEFRGNIEQGLRGTFSSVLRGDFKSIGDMWERLLADMVSQAISAQIAKALFGNGQTGGTSGGGGSGDWISALLKIFFSAKGNAFGQAGVIPFAAGGVFDKPTAFSFGAGKLGVLGEAGPEAVMPLRRGRDGRLGVVAAGGGAAPVVVNQVNHFHAGTSRNELMAGMEIAKREAIAEIMDMQRRGRWGAS